jgi:hypothetical protein
VVLSKKRVVLASLFFALLPLSSCANGPLADAFERSVAADPRLLDNHPLFGGSATPSPTSTAASESQLPSSFPDEIPRYPGAQLLAVDTSNPVATTSSDVPSTPTTTRWSTTDSATQVQQFYQSIFQSNGWAIASSASGATNSTITAEKDGIQVTVTFETPSDASLNPGQSPSPAASGTTEFTLTYVTTGNSGSRAIATSPSASPSSDAASAAPQPGDSDFIGPVWSGRSPSPTTQANGSSLDATSSSAAQTFSDLSQAPEEVRSYIQDLAQLGVLTAGSGEASSQFRPNATITRRDYARWLVAANNAIYANRPAQKIRLGDSTDQPVFQDVPRNDPDFAAIQGLAEAGIIPSPLSNDPTAVTFRPNAPLTRETLILWKAPMDIRQTLPNATVQGVQQSWGFQDANKITPKSLRAVLADYQNGDLSNIRRAFGYTTLFQPQKTVTRAEAAATLWFFGTQGDGLSARDSLQTREQSN